MNDREWTIMIYMAGDNKLDVAMAYAMEQIKRAAGEVSDSLNLFVYYDGNSPSIPTFYCDFSDPGRPRYVPAFSVADKLHPGPGSKNENAADPRSVLDFVDWCANKAEVEDQGRTSRGRRARRYALIFSGHSLGFQDIGLFRDETSDRSMEMKDLRLLLRETTVLLGQKLDILGFDSCVMGMLEVGNQFSSVASTMVASEGSIPSAGWPYERLLGCFRADQRVEAVVENIVREFVRSHEPCTIGGVSVDIAAWDLSRFGDLTRAFDELSMALLQCFEDEGSRLYRQMERALVLVHWKCQSYMYDQNVDLGDFCDLLERECGLIAGELGDDGEFSSALGKVQERCRKVRAELEKAVILSGFCGGAYQYSNGVSVFFPWSRAGYEVSRRNYESLWSAWSVADRPFGWATFMNKYLSDIALRKIDRLTEEGRSVMELTGSSGAQA